MNKQPEITKQTRKNLMDAFWQLYCEKRIEKITVKDITTKAGYNRGTFYEYFTDVYCVLEQIEASVLPNMEKHRDIMMNMNTHLPFKHLTEVYNKNKQYFVVLLGKNGDPAFQEKIKNTYKALVRPGLQPIVEDDYILECTLEYTMSAFISVMTYCFTREENPNIEKMVQLLYSLMNDGVMKILNGTFQSKSWALREYPIVKNDEKSKLEADATHQLPII
jgi:AcrR family transcriptional regulator